MTEIDGPAQQGPVAPAAVGAAEVKPTEVGSQVAAAAETEDDGFEMTIGERFAWFINSPRHQTDDRADRVNDEIWAASGPVYIDAAEIGAYLFVFNDDSVLLRDCDTKETRVFKCAGISDVTGEAMRQQRQLRVLNRE